MSAECAPSKGIAGYAIRVLSFLALTPCSAVAVTYQLTDLGDLPGGTNYSEAMGINNLGQIVGYSYGPDGGRPVLWDNGQIVNLAEWVSVDAFGEARDINEYGQIVGYIGSYACLWGAGQGSLLEIGIAEGINNLGQVVGKANGEATLWDHGTTTRLGTLGGSSSRAFSINDSSQVVGRSTDSNNDNYGFLWQAGAIENIGPEFTLPHINNAGQIVGIEYAMFSPGVLLGLGKFVGFESTTGRAINNHGVVVGNCWDDVVGDQAFLWSLGQGIANLNEALDESGDGWTLNYAYDINDYGQIVGYGNTPDGDRHGFLLTPIPEPSMLMLLLVGIFIRFIKEQNME